MSEANKIKGEMDVAYAKHFHAFQNVYDKGTKTMWLSERDLIGVPEEHRHRFKKNKKKVLI